MAKSKSKYTAGLRFVVSTPAHSLDKHDHKAIRSHATRGVHLARRQSVQLSSWISPGRELGSLKKPIPEEGLTLESIILVPSPRRVGSDLSGLQLPSGVEPYMVQDLVKLIDLNKYGGYPYEICLNVHPVDKGWFPEMISDLCCLHSMMFSLRAFVERDESASHDQLSRLARFHYAQTLQLLQTRLNEFDKTSAISDPTIMTVITLAMAAEVTQDFAAVETHLKGLGKLVSLRGGVRALNTYNNMQAKVCRADLSYALMFGHRPLLFKDDISWDCFIAECGLIQCSHQPYDAIVSTFAETTLDTRLHNALRDLHAFSCISNVAYQTTRKLSPDTYNEMMISILYRLTHLSFESDILQEVIRTGLLVFSSTIFMQRVFMDQPYDHLLSLYSNALSRLRKFTDIDLPVPIVLWLTMLSHAVAHEEPSPGNWRSVWLDEAILRSDINSWVQALEILRSIAWVNFIHDRLGKQAFEAAMLRREKAHGSMSNTLHCEINA